MVLRAAVADPARRGARRAARPAEVAARLLAGYLNDLDDYSGRAFGDPGFLAWNLADYARAGERPRRCWRRRARFVDRAFGMKALPPFAAEPAASDGLFDFSSTTATRVLAVLAAEGATPFIGAWLRERVAPAIPPGFVTRPLDENCWNACVAAALGRAYVVSTDPVFLRAHQTIMAGAGRAGWAACRARSAASPAFDDETCATFYYALALDSLVKA